MNSDRRQFIKATALGLTGLAACGIGEATGSDPLRKIRPEDIGTLQLPQIVYEVSKLQPDGSYIRTRYNFMKGPEYKDLNHAYEIANNYHECVGGFNPKDMSKFLILKSVEYKV
jgi:hypothetical protein